MNATANILVIDGRIAYIGNSRQRKDIALTVDLTAEVLRLRSEGLGIAQIARALKKGHGYVTSVLKEQGAYGQPYYMTDEEKEQVRKLRLEGHSHEVIADSIGRSKAAVIEHLKKLKLNERIIRPITVKGDVAEIKLTRGQVALIDAADVPLVAGRSWFTMGAANKRYAATREGGRPLTLHRFLMGSPADLHVDHINGDGLDNRRSNLRLATPKENGANVRRPLGKTGYIGVQPHRCGDKFFATVQINLGTFDTAEEAARAYDAKAIELFGDFAMTNAKRGLLKD